MGTPNELDLVTENKDLLRGPVLEIGSKDYGNTNIFGPVFKKMGMDYVGTDMEAGENVDVVCDFTSERETLAKQLGDRKFKTIISFCVFEHCKNPHKMAENMDAFLEDGGTLFISVPFVWNIHAYPDDYWRFTPSMLTMLFPKYTLLEDRSCFTTKLHGERLPFGTDLDAIARYSPTFIIGVLLRLHILREKYPYALIPVNVNAILVKGEAGTK